MNRQFATHGCSARRAKDNSPRRKPWECRSYSRQPRRGRKSFVPGQTTAACPVPGRSGPPAARRGTCAGTQASASRSAAPSGADSFLVGFPRLTPWAIIFRPPGSHDRGWAAEDLSSAWLSRASGGPDETLSRPDRGGLRGRRRLRARPTSGPIICARPRSSVVSISVYSRSFAAHAGEGLCRNTALHA